MKTLPDEVMTEAFALSRARGAELLARLGDFSVWHGDLATMRGDEPRQDEAKVDVGHEARTPRVFVDTLILVRAIELLPTVCRAALSRAYVDRDDAAALASELDTHAEHAERIIANCRERLRDIYESLTSGSSMTDTTIPEWV